MKKSFIALIILIFTLCSQIKVFSEEVSKENLQTLSLSEFSEEKTLKDKLRDVYNLEVDRYDVPTRLFSEILTHHYDEKSPLDYTEVWGAYNADVDFIFEDNGTFTNHYNSNALNLGIDGAFKNNNADFRVMVGVKPRDHRNMVKTLFGDVYVGTNKIPHHRIQVGYYRPPVGVEGSQSAYTLPLLYRSQISRTFGTARKLGVKVSGDYSLADYQLGVFSSDTYFHKFFPGAEFAGWINIKPLGKTDGKYGNLKIGAGLQGGRNHSDYCVTGAYVGYDYKKFTANFEWAHANGYNGLSGNPTKKHASGFYTTLGYMLTKKLQLVMRYDQFDPNHDISNNNKREYSAGINYFIKGQGLRLILDYIFCQNDSQKDSHRILLGTQILL